MRRKSAHADLSPCGQTASAKLHVRADGWRWALSKALSLLTEIPHALPVQNPYWYRAITSEPCFWKGKVYMHNKAATLGTLGDNEIAVFKSSPFWMQYTQCHMAM